MRDREPESRVSLAQARELLVQNAPAIGVERIPVEDAAGRIIAEPVFSRLPSPHYRAAAMDGIAVRAADTLAAADGSAVILSIFDEPGNPPADRAVCRAVDTGSPLPEWADAGARSEDIRATDAGYSAAGATATANPYIGVAVSSTVPAQGSVVTHSDSVDYQFARDTNNAVDFPERAGFRLTDDGVLEFRNDPDDDTERWLPMTDPKVVLITNLTITPLATPRQVELYTYCACLVKLTCTAADFQAGGTYYEPTNPSIPRRPTLTIREYGIVLAGRSTADATVQREVRETVRVRNDAMSGRCPSV